MNDKKEIDLNIGDRSLKVSSVASVEGFKKTFGIKNYTVDEKKLIDQYLNELDRDLKDFKKQWSENAPGLAKHYISGVNQLSGWIFKMIEDHGN